MLTSSCHCLWYGNNLTVLHILLVIRCPAALLVPQIYRPYLDESNIGSLLSEALTADVEAVLADETGLVGADAAIISC